MTTCLLVVDVQEGLNHPTYYGSSRSNPSFDSNLNKLLAAFRAAAAANPSAFTVIHVHHHSRWPESPLHLINSPAGVGAMACSKPDGDELVLTKDVNSAFIGTPLESVLKERGVTRLVIVGLTMEHCVTTTTRMAKNLGVTDRVDSASGKKVEGEVILVEDAVAAFGAGKFDAQTIHDVHIESIRNEFANIMSTEGVVVAMVPPSLRRETFSTGWLTQQ
ncbi:putative isochorismatase family hydrolase [Cladochytrium replicatum]|nr:putative isochorismatase family hydrolase [Cladochytrium replicatum]